MANGVQVNYNVVRIVHGLGDAIVYMVGKEHVLVCFIRLCHLIDTQNSSLHYSSNINIKRCAISTRTPHLWKRPMFVMLQFNASGIPWGLPLFYDP